MVVQDLIISKALQGQRQVAVLIDPDNYEIQDLEQIYEKSEAADIDYFFFGGSLITSDRYEEKLGYLKALSKLPVVIFPGNVSQVSEKADALLFLSLISGRNPDLLIGQHVTAAPQLKKMELEIIPTGYMLVDSGKLTTAQYVSATLPLPSDKPEVAAATALAGEMLGLKLIYADGGSGAQKPISTEMIQAIKKKVSLPLIIGGGIRTPQEAENAFRSGADVIVVGNQLEHYPDFLVDLARVKNGTFVSSH